MRIRQRMCRQFTHKHTIPREHAHECITYITHARTHARAHTHTPSHQGQGTLHLRWQGICSAGEGLVADLCTPHGKAVAGTYVGVCSGQREVNRQVTAKPCWLQYCMLYCVNHSQLDHHQAPTKPPMYMYLVMTHSQKHTCTSTHST